MRTGLVFNEIYLRHNQVGHPEHKGRLEAIIEGISKEGLEREVVSVKPRRATAQEVALNHDPAYIQEIHDFCSAGGGYLDPDTYANESSYEVALYAVGGLLSACDRIINNELDTAFCAVRPPGHHAEYGKAMGFCLFNNVAVCARYLRDMMGMEKIFIVDFDAHHGNGTQRSFYEDNTVFYFSTHQYPFYPGTGGPQENGSGAGKGYTLNVPMPAGADDDMYIKAYRDSLPRVIEDFSPDILLVSAGYDLHERDPLTQLEVSNEGVRSIVRSLLGVCRDLGIPSLFTLEGGYDLQALRDCGVITLEEMLRA
jgi:acetoin utilization deacetylase AcuC-like enzyme